MQSFFSKKGLIDKDLGRKILDLVQKEVVSDRNLQQYINEQKNLKYPGRLNWRLTLEFNINDLANFLVEVIQKIISKDAYALYQKLDDAEKLRIEERISKKYLQMIENSLNFDSSSPEVNFVLKRVTKNIKADLSLNSQFLNKYFLLENLTPVLTEIQDKLLSQKNEQSSSQKKSCIK